MCAVKSYLFTARLGVCKFSSVGIETGNEKKPEVDICECEVCGLKTACRIEFGPSRQDPFTHLPVNISLTIINHLTHANQRNKTVIYEINL